MLDFPRKPHTARRLALTYVSTALPTGIEADRRAISASSLSAAMATASRSGESIGGGDGMRFRFAFRLACALAALRGGIANAVCALTPVTRVCDGTHTARHSNVSDPDKGCEMVAVNIQSDKNKKWE